MKKDKNNKCAFCECAFCGRKTKFYYWELSCYICAKCLGEYRKAMYELKAVYPWIDTFSASTSYETDKS